MCSNSRTAGGHLRSGSACNNPEDPAIQSLHDWEQKRVLFKRNLYTLAFIPTTCKKLPLLSRAI